MTTTDRVRLQRHADGALQAFAQIEKVLANSGLTPGLRHLVKLRASQINSCAYCVGLHSAEARADGETNDRLDRVVIWREVGEFTESERAALAWTEALTKLDAMGDLAQLHRDATRHFSDEEIAALTVVIAMINVWNRLQIASHGGSRHNVE